MPKQTPQEGDSSAPLRRYLSGAATLVASINDNETDFDFVSHQGGRIVHLIDTNTLLFCLRPEKESRLLVHIPLHDRSLEADVAKLASMVIFEGAFAGQQAAPLFIIGPHIRELNKRLRRFVEEFHALPSDIEEKKSSALHLQRYSEWRSNGRIQPFEGSIWYTDAIRKRIDRQADGAKPADGTRPSRSKLTTLISQAIDKAHASEVLIKTGADSGTPATHSENTSTDTEVILELIELNALFSRRPQPIRFCLITADRHLHHAVATAFYSNEPIPQSNTTFKECCSEALPTRFIGQFQPALNIFSAKGETRHDFGKTLKSAFQSVLDGFGYKAGRPDVLHFYAGAGSFHRYFWQWHNYVYDEFKSPSLQDDLIPHVPFRRLVDDSIRRANASWAEANREAVQVNRSRLQTQRAIDATEREQVLGKIAATLAEFEIENFGLLLNYYCWSYVHSIRETKDAVATSGPRFDVPTSFDFGNLTEHRSIETFIASLGARHFVSTVPQLIARLRDQETNDATRRLFLGCLALGAGPTVSGIDSSTHSSIRVAQEQFLEVAQRLDVLELKPERRQELLDSDKEIRLAVETLHMLGLSHRVMGICEATAPGVGCRFDKLLADAEKYVIAAQDLASGAGLAMAEWRAESERAAIACAKLLHQLRLNRVGSEKPGTKKRSPIPVQDLAKEAGERLEVGLKTMLDQNTRVRLVKSIPLKVPHDRQHLYDDIALQNLTNVLCYEWLSTGCGQSLHQIDRRLIAFAFDQIETLDDGKHVQSGSFSVSRINYLAASVSTGRKALASHDALSSLRDLARQAKARDQESAKRDLTLTQLDLDELSYLASPAFEESVRRFAKHTQGH